MFRNNNVKSSKDKTPALALITSILIAPVGLILSLVALIKLRRNPLARRKDWTIIKAALGISLVLSTAIIYLFGSGTLDKVVKCYTYGEGVYDTGRRIIFCGNANLDDIPDEIKSDTTLMTGKVGGLTNITSTPQIVDVSLHSEDNQVLGYDIQITTKYDVTRFNDTQMQSVLDDWYEVVRLAGVESFTYSFSEGEVTENLSISALAFDKEEMKLFCDAQCPLYTFIIGNHVNDDSLNTAMSYLKSKGIKEDTSI